MDYVLTITLAANVVVLAALGVYLVRNRRANARLLAREQKKRVNLRRELVVVNEKEAACRKRNQFLRELLSLSHDAILVFSVDHQDEPLTFMFANQAAQDLLAYPEQELRELYPVDIELIPEPGTPQPRPDADHLQIGNQKSIETKHGFARSLIRKQLQAARDGRETEREAQLITKEGHVIPVRLQTFYLPEQNGEDYFVYTAVDIRVARKRSRQLLASEHAYQTLFQAARIGIAHYGPDRTLLHANAACLRIFGSPTVEELRALPLFRLPALDETVQTKILRGEDAQTEITLDFDQLITHSRFVTRRHGKAFLELFIQNLGRDADHQHRGYLVQIADRTELRQTESALELRETQLLHARKMETIGTMTGGIAHDFNNILMPILGYSEISLDFCQDSPELKEFITEIRNASLRAKELVSQILIYSRQTDEEESLIRLSPIIKEVAKQQGRVLGPDITVACKLRTENDLVLANATQIHQILTNLCTNAGYAMRETGGNLDIQLSAFNQGWRHRHEFPQLRKGTYLRISVRDSGPGISEDLREKIFDPFFSTKPHGEGTGMGLAVVQSIVDASGGAIALDSSEGEGATFHIALPLVEAQAKPEASDWSPTPASGGTILFVDDDPAIAQLATVLLQTLGFTPYVYTDPTKALEYLEKQAPDIDGLITDQVMPDCTGLELAQQAARMKPGLPILICTGFPGRVDLEQARQIGIKGILLKPVGRKELGQALEKILRGESLPETHLQEQTGSYPPKDGAESEED